MQQGTTSTSLDHVRDAAADYLSHTTMYGGYAFSSTVEQFPHPGLRVEGVGCIGLPLTDVSPLFATYGPSRASLEISAGDVSFDNPRWTRWVHNTIVSEANKGLGLEHTNLATFRKLVIVGPQIRYNFTPPVTRGSHATFTICLPTEHESEPIHLFHASDPKNFTEWDPSIESAHTLSWGVWVSDVHVQTCPIESGFRMMLVYDLHNAELSQVMTLTKAQDKLEQALASWCIGSDYSKDGRDHHLCWALENEYDSSRVTNNDLHDIDAHHARSLHKTCKHSGVLLCLAMMEHTVDNFYEDYITTKPDTYGNHGIHMKYSEYWYIRNIVTLDGQEIADIAPSIESNLIQDESLPPFWSAPTSEVYGAGPPGMIAYHRQQWNRPVLVMIANRDLGHLTLGPFHAGRASSVAIINRLLKDYKTGRQTFARELLASTIKAWVTFSNGLLMQYYQVKESDDDMICIAIACLHLDDPDLFEQTVDLLHGSLELEELTALISRMIHRDFDRYYSGLDALLSPDRVVEVQFDKLVSLQQYLSPSDFASEADFHRAEALLFQYKCARLAPILDEGICLDRGEVEALVRAMEGTGDDFFMEHVIPWMHYIDIDDHNAAVNAMDHWHPEHWRYSRVLPPSLSRETGSFQDRRPGTETATKVEPAEEPTAQPQPTPQSSRKRKADTATAEKVIPGASKKPKTRGTKAVAAKETVIAPEPGPRRSRRRKRAA